MAFGDVGGAENWRIVTAKTPGSGSISIAKGDAVKLSGGFEATNALSAEDPVLGQAMGATTENSAALAVGVRGVFKFRSTGVSPLVNGTDGVTASDTDGKVKKPASGSGRGLNLKVEVTKQTITLASVAATEAVAINGITFTAHADTTTAADREFSISGDDTADAVELKNLINDATYGVPGVMATSAAGVVTVEADDLDNTTVAVVESESTITPAVDGGNVWVLL